MSGENNGWSEWSKHVLAELKRLNNNYDELSKEVNIFELNMVRDITALKIKCGLWGGLAGAIPAAIAIAFMIMDK